MAFLAASAFALVCSLCITGANVLHKRPSLFKKLPTEHTSYKTTSIKKKNTLKSKPTYSFGALAANSPEQARALGFVKNDTAFNPESSQSKNLQEGHCVIVPRSDNSFSYGVVTEEITPGLVCVACDNKSHHYDGFTVKIIPANELFLEPEWLKALPKDNATLNLYKRENVQSIPQSKKFFEEEPL